MSVGRPFNVSQVTQRARRTIVEINRPQLFVAGFSLCEPAATFFNTENRNANP
jgi:hypothetical protein